MPRTAQLRVTWRTFFAIGRAVDAILFNGGSLHPRRCAFGSSSRLPNGKVARARNPRKSRAGSRRGEGSGPLWKPSASTRRTDRGRGGSRHLPRSAPARPKTVKQQRWSAFFPRDACREEEFRISQPGLELRLNHPVRFQPYYSTRHDADKAGSVVPLNDRDFQRLPSLQTVAKLQARRRRCRRRPDCPSLCPPR